VGLQVGEEEDALSGGDPPLLGLDHFRHGLSDVFKALFCCWIERH